MLTFALAVFLLIATPGPGVLSTAGVGSAFGWRPGLSYVTGLWAGTNLVSLAIITGLAAILFRFRLSEQFCYLPHLDIWGIWPCVLH